MSKALEIAAKLEESYAKYFDLPLSAAAELRRLHELNAKLVAALEACLKKGNRWHPCCDEIVNGQKALAKAKEQV